MQLSLCGGFFFIGGIMLYLSLNSNQALHYFGRNIAVIGFILLCISICSPIHKMFRKLAKYDKSADSEHGTEK